MREKSAEVAAAVVPHLGFSNAGSLLVTKALRSLLDFLCYWGRSGIEENHAVELNGEHKISEQEIRKGTRSTRGKVAMSRNSSILVSSSFLFRLVLF